MHLILATKKTHTAELRHHVLNEQRRNVIKSFKSRGNFPPIRKKKHVPLRFYLQICCTWAIWKLLLANLLCLLCTFVQPAKSLLFYTVKSSVPCRPCCCKYVSLKIDKKIRGRLIRVDNLWPSSVPRFWTKNAFTQRSKFGNNRI